MKKRIIDISLITVFVISLLYLILYFGIELYIWWVFHYAIKFTISGSVN